MKILIAEDDAFFQKFYSTKLTEKDFEVITASDGEETLAKVLESKPDLILLDLIMPKKDGFEVLTALSKDAISKDIPVIVFSSLGQEQDVKRAKTLGAKDYINKGFYDFDSLVAKISMYKKQ
ncbi:MAG: response regulator [Candidatus Levyibacteriota bacterium]|nr:MAG: response regulator [Candidatus Levybacteria bacterium]